MTVHCLACGAGVSASAPSCPHCRTALRGSSHARRVVVQAGRPLSLPRTCCCCLGPQELLDRHSITLGKRGNKRYAVRISLPWCRTCQWTRWAYLAAITVVFVALLVLGGGLALHFELGLWGWIGTLVAALLVGGVGSLGVQKIPAFDRPGHVPGCDAFEGRRHGVLDAQTVELTFRNRAFGEAFAELNGRCGGTYPRRRRASPFSPR